MWFLAIILATQKSLTLNFPPPVGILFMKSQPEFFVLLLQHPHQSKKKASDPTPAARPIWLAECLEVDLATEKGLFRWYRTKISTSDWTKSGWVEDDKYTYGIGKAIINGRIGEWLGLDTVLVWGFKLNPHPATNPRSTLYAHDVNDMRAEARDRNLMWD